MHEDAQTARAMQRSINENLTRLEQTIETYREQVHLAAAREGERTRLATLGEIEVAVLTLARRAAEVGAIQPFQDQHGRWHGAVEGRLGSHAVRDDPPCLDGNGRVGRRLIPRMVGAEGILKRLGLYVSLPCKRHRTRYYAPAGCRPSTGALAGLPCQSSPK